METWILIFIFLIILLVIGGLLLYFYYIKPKKDPDNGRGPVQKYEAPILSFACLSLGGNQVETSVLVQTEIPFDKLKRIRLEWSKTSTFPSNNENVTEQVGYNFVELLELNTTYFFKCFAEDIDGNQTIYRIAEFRTYTPIPGVVVTVPIANSERIDIEVDGSEIGGDTPIAFYNTYIFDANTQEEINASANLRKNTVKVIGQNPVLSGKAKFSIESFKYNIKSGNRYFLYVLAETKEGQQTTVRNVVELNIP